ncbi:hypothetical protein OJF2_77050 [Aquisphaera giovannonii]|uniref:Uncharacterized protein n=1 Tax=Aquisphaera giovannonii TaxID=406548 RepID=A0A5B9WF47_9BACT|nr:hypothetical protein [Aquisphaera giovannonii]QEH39093.1 hypothetical protein OJF2_77050 [Aquisphaera giovannonii]
MTMTVRNLLILVAILAASLGASRIAAGLGLLVLWVLTLAWIRGASILARVRGADRRVPLVPLVVYLDSLVVASVLTLPGLLAMVIAIVFMTIGDDLASNPSGSPRRSEPLGWAIFAVLCAILYLPVPFVARGMWAPGWSRPPGRRGGPKAR